MEKMNKEFELIKKVFFEIDKDTVPNSDKWIYFKNLLERRKEWKK